MIEVSIIAAFIAGLVTFLAPCTLPLVPGYLAFISGVPATELADPMRARKVRWKIFWNGVFFTIGFSVIFIIFGTFIGILGGALAKYQIWLNRIGGGLIILFGLMMLDVLKIPFLQTEHRFFRIGLPSFIKRGKPTSSFVLGSAFGVGWTPCVGPVLGAILTLAATVEGATQGAFLLAIFSTGLAVPFLIIALGVGQATRYIERYSSYLRVTSIIGGLFLVFLGILLALGKLSLLLAWGFQFLEFIGLGSLEDLFLDYL